MPCFDPIPAARDSGYCRDHLGYFSKSPVRLHPKGPADLALPCGQCLGCRLARAQEWAARIMHETQDHNHCQFVTLTYSDEHLPSELVPRDLTLFLKRTRSALARLRKHNPAIVGNPAGSLYYRKLRYFACGEYGDITERPHYHAILFGIRFDDAERYGNDLWSSPTLTQLWGLGHVRYGNVTHQSAAYVAHYTRKTAYGQPYCDSNGEVKHAPFGRCSIGIGGAYATRNSRDLVDGRVFAGTRVVKSPRYYRKRLENLGAGVEDKDEAEALNALGRSLGEQADYAAYSRAGKTDPRNRTEEGRRAKYIILKSRDRLRQL